MWQEVGEVAADLLLPNTGPEVDRIFDEKKPDQLRVPITDQDAFKRRLTQSGWFDEEIVAAGMLNQGKAQSLVSMLTGWALVETVRGRRCKALSRDFCLVVTADRVVALDISAVAEGGDGSVLVVRVERGERGSWSRGSVRIDRDERKLKSGQTGGMLDLPGLGKFPVNWEDEEELVSLLSR
jgi:hypothetical protein